MNDAVRDMINEMLTEARKIAHDVLNVPRTEREYLIAVGKYQERVALARRLKERFLDPEREATDAETELPEDEATDEKPDPRANPTRRVDPQPDRLTQQRSRHRPRQM